MRHSGASLMNVSELRLVVTTEDYDAAVAFYRDSIWF